MHIFFIFRLFIVSPCFKKIGEFVINYINLQANETSRFREYTYEKAKDSTSALKLLMIVLTLIVIIQGLIKIYCKHSLVPVNSEYLYFNSDDIFTSKQNYLLRRDVYSSMDLLNLAV